MCGERTGLNCTPSCWDSLAPCCPFFLSMAPSCSFQAKVCVHMEPQAACLVCPLEQCFSSHLCRRARFCSYFQFIID